MCKSHFMSQSVTFNILSVAGSLRRARSMLPLPAVQKLAQDGMRINIFDISSILLYNDGSKAIRHGHLVTIQDRDGERRAGCGAGIQFLDLRRIEKRD
jgi:hypothetical protein